VAAQPQRGDRAGGADDADQVALLDAGGLQDPAEGGAIRRQRLQGLKEV